MHRPSTSNDVADRRETTITGADDGDTVEPWNRAAGSSRRAFIKAGGIAALAALTPAALADRASAATTRPPTQFTQFYGTAIDEERVNKVIQASDGGYALVGSTRDHYIGGDWNPAGWLVKTNAEGVQQWAKTFEPRDIPGDEFENHPEFTSGVQTRNGGYALAGFIVNSKFVDRNRQVWWLEDFWLVRTSSNGTVRWVKTYGSPDFSERAHAIVQTDDGGFVLLGNRQRRPGLKSRPMLVKTTGQGTVQWTRLYSSQEFARGLVKTNDGGFAIAGTREVNGQSRMWLMKTDAQGTAQWSRTYTRSGMQSSDGRALVQTKNGGYAIAGGFGSTIGESDMWLVKTDANGAMQWNRRYSRAGHANIVHSLTRTSDGGYALAGQTSKLAASTDRRRGDMWLVKTDSRGIRQWSWRLNGPATDTDSGQSVIRTRDGGLAVAGYVGMGDTENPSSDGVLVKFAP